MIKRKKELEELRKITIVDAKKKILKLQALISKIRFNVQGKAKNIKKINQTKKEIARIFTVINEETKN